MDSVRGVLGAIFVLLCMSLSACGGEDTEGYVGWELPEGSGIAQAPEAGVDDREFDELLQIAESVADSPIEEEGIETSSHALRGLALPEGCPGGERRYAAAVSSYAFLGWRWELQLRYYLPNREWCWISHHARFNAGDADRWDAALRRDHRGGHYPDQLEVMVPSHLWMPIYAGLRRAGYSHSRAMSDVIHRFWAWAYYL